MGQRGEQGCEGAEKRGAGSRGLVRWRGKGVLRTGRFKTHREMRLAEQRLISSSCFLSCCIGLWMDSGLQCALAEQQSKDTAHQHSEAAPSVSRVCQAQQTV